MCDFFKIGNIMLTNLSSCRNLNFRDNQITSIAPNEMFNGFQFTLFKLDLSGNKNGVSNRKNNKLSIVKITYIAINYRIIVVKYT